MTTNKHPVPPSEVKFVWSNRISRAAADCLLAGSFFFFVLARGKARSQWCRFGQLLVKSAKLAFGSVPDCPIQWRCKFLWLRWSSCLNLTVWSLGFVRPQAVQKHRDRNNSTFKMGERNQEMKWQLSLNLTNLNSTMFSCFSIRNTFNSRRVVRLTSSFSKGYIMIIHHL